MANKNHFKYLVDFLSPDENTLGAALHHKLFKREESKRDAIHYRYRIVPLLMDFLEHFFQEDAVIDANSMCFSILDDSDKTNGILNEEDANHISTLLEDFVTLSTDNNFLTEEKILETIEISFPELSDCLSMHPDGPRKPVPGKINSERFLYNLKCLTVSFTLNNYCSFKK